MMHKRFSRAWIVHANRLEILGGNRSLERRKATNINVHGVVFDNQGGPLGGATVWLSMPLGVTAADRPQEERKGAGRWMGTIRFDGQGALGPPLALIGTSLTMQLDDGGSLDFRLFDSGHIQVIRMIEA